MKERSKNKLGYGALLLGGITLAVATLAGNSNRLDTSAERNKTGDLKHSVLTQQFAHQLASKNEARNLLVASILIGSGKALMPASRQKTNEGLAAQWMRSAIEAGQSDVLIAWYEATHCFGDKVCNAGSAIARLEKLDPENAAVHLLALNYAQLGNDQADMDATFLRAVNSRYYNSYYHEYAKATYLSMAGWQPEKNDAEREDDAKNWGLDKPPSDEDYRKIQALGMALAFPLPGFQSFTNYCDGSKKGLDRKEACIKLFEMIRNDNTAISKAVALSMLSKLTVGHPKGPQFREELRQHYWMRENQNKLNKMRPEYDSSYIQQWPHLTEWESLIVDMRKAEIPLTAPESWMPFDPGQRSRVLTGLDPKY